MSRRVLVVDDEDDVRTFVRLVLETAGYEVRCAADGKEALQAIHIERPDLVVLDLMMPVMDGWQVLAAIAHEHPPLVVVLSAAADLSRAQVLGAAATVAKPFR